MKYDFTSHLNRQGKDALAVEEIPVRGATVQPGFDRIPMWIADMNFPTAPSVIEELSTRIHHPAFGYFNIPEQYYEAIQYWMKELFGVQDITREDITYENGVLGGITTALYALTSPNEPVLLNSPAYIGFTSTLQDTGRKAVYSPLVRDQNGVWRLDLADMEEKIKENHIHVMILCSPHNPTGRVWTKEELLAVSELAQRYQMTILADEIWSDLVLREHQHIPFHTVSSYAREHSASFYAIGKTFNLAGLRTSYNLVFNQRLRDTLEHCRQAMPYSSANVLSVHALIGAYSPPAREWVKELNEVLSDNAEYATRYIREHFDGVLVSQPEGTYMLYLDCHEWCMKHQTDMDTLLKKGISVGVIWQDGRPFFFPDSIRMNLALPSDRVHEAFERLDHYVFNERSKTE